MPITTHRERPASRSLARGGMSLTAAGLISGIANYATNAILARSLDPAAFGDAAVAITLMLATTGLAGVVQLATAQRVASTGEVVTRRLGLRVGAITGLALAAASPFLAALLNTDGPTIFVMLAFGIPFQMLLALERGRLQGHLRFAVLAATFVVEGALRLVVTALALGLGATAHAAPIGISAGLAVSSTVAMAMGRPSGRPISAPRSGAAAAPLAATAALLMGQILLVNADILIVKYSFAPTVAGGFALAALAGRAFHFIAAAITNSVFPVVAAAPGSEQATQAVQRAALVLGALGALATVAAWTLADTIVAVLGAVDDPAAASLVGPYVLATVLVALAHLFAAVDVAGGARRAAGTMVAVGTLQALTIVAFAGDAPAVLDIRIAISTVLAIALARRALRTAGGAS